MNQYRCPHSGSHVRRARREVTELGVVRERDPRSDLPVNPIAVTFSILMLAGYAIGGVLRAHHVAVWGTLLVVGALPVWTGADPSNVGLVLCGAALIVCGVLDHLAFVRTFGPSELPQLGNGNARA